MNELKYYAKDLIIKNESTEFDIEYFTEYSVHSLNIHSALQAFNQTNSIRTQANDSVNALNTLGELVKKTLNTLNEDRHLTYINYQNENNYFRKLNLVEERILMNALHKK